MPGPLRDRLHLRHAAAVLAPIVLASALLAYWAWQASVRHHAVAVALLRSQGQLAAQRYAGRVGDELYVAATALFQPVGGGRMGGAAAGGRLPPLVDPQAILDSVPALARCRCAPVLKPALAFRTDLTAAGTRVVGPAAPDPAASAETRAALHASLPAALVDAVGAHLPQFHGGWDVGVIAARRADAGALAGRVLIVTHRTARRGDPSSRVLYGVAVDTAMLRSAVFRPVLREGPLLATAPGAGDAPNDTLIALRVRDRAGRTVFGTRAAPDPAHAATVVMRPEWGLLAIEVSAREPAARAVLAGGLPRSPVPMLVALVLVAAALLGGALALLWRMLALARLRSDFTSSVSHELRTPLTQILLYAEGLELGHHRSRAERAQALGVITRETRRLIHLVENVLHFSRAERRLVRVAARAQPLAPLAADVIESFAPIARARRVEVTLDAGGAGDADGAAPVAARVDGEAFRRVLLNLLDNAVRYGPAGQTVRVALSRAGGWARLAVEDEGEGIPEGERERVWRPFVRLPRDVTEANAGGGIGLAIVRELVALHGGRARVESAAGGGARLVVELPAEEMQPAAAPLARASAAVQP